MSFSSPVSRAIFVFVNTDLLLEDLPYCPADKAVGGISTRIWYAPVECFESFTISKNKDKFRSYREVKEGEIKIFEGKRLRYIDVFIDNNSLVEKTIGSIRKWKLSTELNLSILELNSKNTGFISKIKNKALVIFIVDNNNRVWILGNKINAAYLSNYEGLTNKKYEDDNLLNISFKANTELLVYTGDFSLISALGGFTEGFSSGFRI